MLFVPCLPGDEVCGDYNCEQLLEMNNRFVAVVQAAFAAGLESRAAAEKTVNVNGRQRLTEEGTIELAWRFFVAAKFEMTAVEIRARCPCVAPERVRVAFRERLFSQIGHTRTKEHRC